ncbi:MAG: hypothetical protein IKU26_08630 [Clostridia bacterium]|nr:hypothetical protein [Clostridia bacterium]
MYRQEILKEQSLYQKMVQFKEYLVDKIETIQFCLTDSPEGELYCTKNRAWTKWYVRLEGKIIYLPKEERDLAYALADKKLLTALESDLQYDLNEVNQYLQHHQDNPQKAKKLLTVQSTYAELFDRDDLFNYLSEWSNKHYETNVSHMESKIHTAPGNLLVRSKAEAMIATLLTEHQIPFRYECALQFDKRIIYPDFTLRHPKTGEFFYWEHFGKMEDPEYQKNAFDKMQLYAQNGIQPHIQLIITAETSAKPLTTHTIQCRIQEFFSAGQLDTTSWAFYPQNAL